MKLGAYTPSVIVALEVREPDVPVIVSTLLPTLAELLAVNVRTVFPVAGFGENDAVTPAGSPETVKLTLPVNPYSAFT